MKTSFVSFVKNRFLLADLAYAMLNRGWIEAAPESEACSIISTLLTESGENYEGIDTADEFFYQAYTTELLFPRGNEVRWQSSKIQSYLAAPVLYVRYHQQSSHDEQEAAAWFQEKAVLTQWHEAIALMSYFIEDEKNACKIENLLAPIAPSLTMQYRGQLKEGFFDMPWFERRFLGEIAWPLGDVSFWKEALQDCDFDVRRQATLVLGTACIAEAKGSLTKLLNDDNSHVRAWAVWALGRLAATDVRDRLSLLLEDPSQRVRFQARRALALIQEEGTTTRSVRQCVVDRAGIKILVSDDEPEMWDLYKLILSKRGYKVLYAPGGEQTLELARRELPDLVITDIMNIHLMGTDLAFELRNEPVTQETTIAFISAQPILWYSGVLPWLGFFMGADVYLRKPFSPAELLAFVDEILFA